MSWTRCCMRLIRAVATKKFQARRSDVVARGLMSIGAKVVFRHPRRSSQRHLVERRYSNGEQFGVVREVVEHCPPGHVVVGVAELMIEPDDWRTLGRPSQRIPRIELE